MMEAYREEPVETHEYENDEIGRNARTRGGARSGRLRYNETQTTCVASFSLPAPAVGRPFSGENSQR